MVLCEMVHIILYLHAAIVVTVSFVGSVLDMEAITYEAAETACANHGGLATSTLFNAGPWIPGMKTGHVSDVDVRTMGLIDGETAWVRGHVKYGPYIAWHTCTVDVNTTRYVKTTLTSNTLYDCSMFCSNFLKKTRGDLKGYVGVNGDDCYCFDDTYVFEKKIACALVRNNTTGIHVFAFVSELSKLVTDSRYQCIAVNTTNTGITYFTRKCTTLLKCICTDSITLKIKGHDDFCPLRKNENYRICITRQSYNWSTGLELCISYSGTFNKKILNTMETYLDSDHNYFIGSFRPFTGRKNVVDPSLCISVMLTRNELFLEPDECTQRKKYVCMDKLISEKQSESNKSSALIVAFICVSISLVVIITTILLYINRKRILSYIQRRSDRVNNDEGKGTSGNTGTYYSSCDVPNLNITTNPSSGMETKSYTTQPTVSTVYDHLHTGNVGHFRSGDTMTTERNVYDHMMSTMPMVGGATDSYDAVNLTPISGVKICPSVDQEYSEVLVKH